MNLFIIDQAFKLNVRLLNTYVVTGKDIDSLNGVDLTHL